MHQRAKVWAKDQSTKWTTRFRSRAPRKRERKITLSKSQRGLPVTSASWWRRLLGLEKGGWLRSLLYRLPFMGEVARGPWRVVQPNTMAGVGVSVVAGGGQRFAGNKIHTHKYGPFSFLPRNLYEQFKRLANLWFLIIAILHLIPEISSLNPAASLIPLIFVLGVTAIKEAVEDVKRRIEDKKINSKTATLYSSSSGGFITAMWKDLRVGDVIKLRNGDQVPADILLLNSSDPDGLCYIETANLDGETNLKIRQALSETIETLEDEDMIPYFQGTAAIPNVPCIVADSPINQIWLGVVECEHPNAELYNFEGTLLMDADAERVPINLDQTLWRGCTLRNTEWIYGLVINTGMETKVMKNARKPPSKRSTLEKDMNKAIFTVILLGVLLAGIAGVFNGIWTSDKGFDHWYLSLKSFHTSAALHGLSSFGSWLILINVIIPISLYVYMEMIKLVMCYYINSDINMYHDETNTPARANTSNLAEELGQIEYVFSDKTGTLTSNQMNFMRCSVKGKVYGYPPDRIFEEDEDIKPLPEQVFVYRDPDLLKAVQGNKYDSEESQDVHLFFRALALCHSVVIERLSSEAQQDLDQASDHEVLDQEDHNISSREGNQRAAGVNAETRIEYQAASPDESALVLAAQQLGFELYDRDKESIYVRVQGLEERWELLNILEFNSERKRMSVILRDPTTGVVRLFCKGADTVIFERLAEGQEKLKETTYQHLAAFGSEGLRTLVFASRVIPSDEYDTWNESYRQAALKIYGREEAMDAVAEEIEKEMELLGATAIEDKLQDGVPQAISTLLSAGLKMWVLTGDKMETAINIGYSCSLLTQEMKTLVLSSEEVEEEPDAPVVVSPQTAIHALERHFERHFSSQVIPWTRAKIDEFLFSLSTGSLGAPTTDGSVPGLPRDTELRELRNNTDNRGSEVDQSEGSEDDDEEEDGARPGEFALVIDGKALSQYLPSSGAFNELSARFLELAMRCKAVICCRVTPLQKSLVVNLVKKGLKATTLAIGDGANDVPMIQAANVGVGISGKEGRQAVMAADYAIAQFRFLVSLLLVHGQWSYRRMCKLVLYSFWKNMLFAMTDICFGFYSAFSAQTLYDSWAVSFYNLLFTGLPIFLVAAFDQPISRKQIRDYPPLYRNGIRHQSFSPFKYWQWQIWAVIQAVIITMFSVAAFRNDILLGTGQTLDAFSLGLEIMTAVILTVNAKIFLVTNTWTVWNHVAVWGSVATWFLFIVVYAPIPTTRILGPNLFGWVTYKAMSSAFYWLGAILVTAIAILPDLVYCYLRRTYLPENYHVVQEMHLLSAEDQRRMRRRERSQRMRRKLTSLYKGKRIAYTGFAFAQAPGVRDLMMTLGLSPVPSEKKQQGKTNNKGREEDLEQEETHRDVQAHTVRDDTSRRGAREEEAFHDDLLDELARNY